jgi:ABC-type enterochelin transport system substrate-binding protein
MQFSAFYLSLVLATVVVAKGGKGNSTMKAVTDKSLCREMKSLNQLVKLASNETKLADKTHNNATKIADIQAKASEASTKLTTMEANITLTITCSVMAAAEKTEVPPRTFTIVQC